MTQTNQEELAFERYLKKCKELHEQWHPFARYNEEKFKELALQEWNRAEDEDKNKFRQNPKKIHALKNETPFITFSKAKRHEILASNPGMKPIDIMHKIEDLWMNLPHSEKIKYNAMHKEFDSLSLQSSQSSQTQ